MTTIEIHLPDDLAQSAARAGLLSDQPIRHLMEDAIRRHAGRALVDVARDIRAANVPPMSMEEIDAEVKYARAERRTRSGDAGGS